MSIDIAGSIEQYLRDLTQLPSEERGLDRILKEALVGDRELRRLFAVDPGDQRLSDLYIGLIDVFKLPASLSRTRACNVAPALPEFEKHYVFPLEAEQRRPHLAPSIVPSFPAFLECWDIFSHSSLSKMKPSDWANVIVAGGSVLASLIAQHPPLTSAEAINYFYLGDAWGASDIDLFLWGLTAEQAILKIKNIYHAICAAARWPVTCVRKANVISIHTRYPLRPIQIILRLYDSPAQILAGFDVDAACCAFDGQSVWVNPRSLTAIIRQANTVDITRRSPSYELRLAKYAERGFEISIPSLSRNAINPMLYDPTLERFPRGLARLLVLEKLYYNPQGYIRLKYPRTRVQVEDKVALEDEDPLGGNTEDAKAIEKSFYETDLRWCQIPYGPFWDAIRIERVITKQAKYLNSRWNRENRGQETHKHVIFAGTLENCLRGKFCEKCSDSQATSDADEHLPNAHIRGPVRFIVTNPGQQLLSGSFNPIDDEEWESEAYLATRETREFADAISGTLRIVADFHEAAVGPLETNNA